MKLLTKIQNLFSRKRDEEPEDYTSAYHNGRVRIHNFCISYWGHAMTFHMSPGACSFIGHSQNHPKKGDVFLTLSRFADGNHVARYRVTEIHPMYNPRDMYSGEAVFVKGRTDPQIQNDKVGVGKELDYWEEGEESWRSPQST